MNGKKRRRQAGFSLVELMVVISIIGLLSAIVAVNVMKNKEKANAAKVRADVSVLGNAIKAYYLDCSKYPSGLEDLIQGSDEGWDGPYIEGGPKALRDPWKRPYVYSLEGSGTPPYDIGSYGADGAPGGDGDNKDVFPLRDQGR